MERKSLLKLDAVTVALTAPYLCWMALLLALPAQPGFYALRTLCAAVLLVPALRFLAQSPRTDLGEEPPRTGSILFWGTLTGLVVFLLWVAPESWGWYQKLFILGDLPAADAPAPYDPANCGWPLTLARLAGSAFVIAPAEEFFFRGFLYRRLQSADWTRVPPSRFDASAFLWTVGLFALEHNRWLAGALAGALYGWVALRKGLWAAILAHVVTNLVLALYVIESGEWAFW